MSVYVCVSVYKGNVSVYCCVHLLCCCHEYEQTDKALFEAVKVLYRR